MTTTAASGQSHRHRPKTRLNTHLNFYRKRSSPFAKEESFIPKRLTNTLSVTNVTAT